MLKFIIMAKVEKLNREIAEVEARLLNAPTREDFDKYAKLIEKRHKVFTTPTKKFARG